MEIYLRSAPPRRRWRLLILVAGVVVVSALGLAWHVHLVRRAERRAPVAITLASPAVGWGEWVSLGVRVLDSGGKPTLSVRPIVVVHRAGRPLCTIGGAVGLALTKDYSHKSWTGRWPVPWGARAGDYSITASIELAPRGNIGGDTGAEHAYSQAVARFTVRGAPAAPAVPRFCAVTLETTADFRRSEAFSAVWGPDGSRGDWKQLLEWAEFIGADTFWYLAGETAAWTTRLPPGQPWSAANLAQVEEVGKEVHRRGMRYGVWIASFVAYGPRGYGPSYWYTWDKGTRRGISIADKKRIADIVSLVKRLNAIPVVDMVGLDYIRTGLEEGGLELTDQFVAEVRPPGLPADWETRSPKARMGWLRERVAEQEDPVLSDLWNWWRAGKVAAIVRRVREESGLHKPLWVFTLSWAHGMQHGQDPFMMAAAGVSLDAVMLYEANKEQFSKMPGQWHLYSRAHDLNLAVGNVVDWQRLDRSIRPPGPEEYYRRLRQGSLFVLDQGKLGGVFIHDLARLALSTSAVGPYSRREWAVAAARAISEARADWGVTPIRLTLRVPQRVSWGERFKADVRVTNLGKEAVKELSIYALPMPGVACDAPRALRVDKIPSGGSATVILPMRAIGLVNGNARDNQAMVAVRCQWAGSGPTVRATTFAYLRLSPSVVRE